MKFIVDQQLPPALAEWLIEKGHEAQHVYPLGLGDAEDSVIWDAALRDDAVIVTKDVDYAERRRRTHGPTIVWLRVGNSTTRHLLEFMEMRWPLIESGLRQDAVIEVR